MTRVHTDPTNAARVRQEQTDAKTLTRSQNEYESITFEQCCEQVPNEAAVEAELEEHASLQHGHSHGHTTGRSAQVKFSQMKPRSVTQTTSQRVPGYRPMRERPSGSMGNRSQVQGRAWQDKPVLGYNLVLILTLCVCVLG